VKAPPRSRLALASLSARGDLRLWGGRGLTSGSRVLSV
jgi:hypothetical protein